MKIIPNNIAVIEGDSHLAVWIEQCGRLNHDDFMTGVIRDLIISREIKKCVNAGANIGSLAIVMLDQGCEVHAFEPNPDAYACLLHNCEDAITTRCALGEKRGKTNIVQCENAGASFLSDNQDGISVEVMTLDYFELRPDFILADVEGCEIKFLIGAAQTIRIFKPAMILEVNREALKNQGGSEAELLSLISEMGYAWQIIQPQSSVGDPQYDVLCLPILR